jgi:predicted AlkP superfamily pyrophosphatase or phosphodiesterase
MWLRLALAALLVNAVSCTTTGSDAGAPPRLVVVIVVDQMCSHHVTRFRDLYTGGLRRLLEQGAVFDNAWHDHAKTYTSPGHASIATGAQPARHGIVANVWYDRTRDFAVTYSARDEEAHTIGHPDRAGASPRQLLSDALGDWLKAQSSRSKVYSVALKDYSAVLMGGQRPDAVFWYDVENGTYCSSIYYLDEYPQWVRDFNGGRPADDYVDAVWTRSKSEAAYARSRTDRFAAEADGEHTTFPYAMDATAESRGETFYQFLRYTPFADELTLRFAAAIVDNEALGADDEPDLLFVGCSAADFIGHEWGPYSQEAEDYYLKLDEYLDAFLGMLDEKVGADHYAVVFTSDHGVDPIPEGLAGEVEGAVRIDRKTYDADIDSVAARIADELGIDVPLVAHRSRGLVLDPAAVPAGMPAAELRGRMSALIEKFPYVEEAFTYDELAAAAVEEASTPHEEFFRLYRNGFHPERSPDLYVLFKEHRLVTSSKHGTTHGSPHDYDRHVPLVFWGRGVGRGEIETRVRTIDVAPTAAGLLGIDVPPGVDGRSLLREMSALATENP